MIYCNAFNSHEVTMSQSVSSAPHDGGSLLSFATYLVSYRLVPRLKDLMYPRGFTGICHRVPVALNVHEHGFNRTAKQNGAFERSDVVL